MRVTFNELAEREFNDAAHYYQLERILAVMNLRRRPGYWTGRT